MLQVNCFSYVLINNTIANLSNTQQSNLPPTNKPINQSFQPTITTIKTTKTEEFVYIDNIMDIIENKTNKLITNANIIIKNIKNLNFGNELIISIKQNGIKYKH